MHGRASGRFVTLQEKALPDLLPVVIGSHAEFSPAEANHVSAGCCNQNQARAGIGVDTPRSIAVFAGADLVPSVVAIFLHRLALVFSSQPHEKCWMGKKNSESL